MSVAGRTIAGGMIRVRKAGSARRMVVGNAAVEQRKGRSNDPPRRYLIFGWGSVSLASHPSEYTRQRQQ